MKGKAFLLLAIIHVSFCEFEGAINNVYQVGNESEICSQIGIEENAVLNSCGFCTEGDTGLNPNYGFDCNNICNGQSYLDCNNQCNGNSFIDVCTGTCIKSSENLTLYANRDCRGMCLSSVIDSNRYVKNECGQCQLVCDEDQQQCDNFCDFNQTEAPVICGNDIEDSDPKSLTYKSCNECTQHNTIGCSCRLDPALCGCNSSNDCYYISSIDPNVVPTNTPINIFVSGYFNGLVRDIQCHLIKQRDGTELLFEAKLLNTTSMECNINLTQAGEYVFGLHSALLNKSYNYLNFSAYDADLVFFSNMNPKKILTTSFKNSIELMFDSQNQITFNFKTLLKCKIVYNWKQIVVNSNNGNSCVIPSSESHSKSQQIVVIPTFDGIHSVSNPLNFSLKIISPFPRFVNELCFISENGLNIILAFERPVNIFAPKTMFAQEVCDHYLTNSTLNRLKFFGLNYCKWLTTTQLLITLNYSIDVNFIEISIREQTIKELGQSIAETNTKDIELIVKKRISNRFYDIEPQILLRGPTLIPICGPFSLSAYFYSPKGSTNVVFKWSVTTLPLRNDLISDKLFKIIDSNNKTSLLLLGEMFSLEAISYKLTISALFDDRTAIEASHQLLRSRELLPIVTIFPTPQPNQHWLYSHNSQTLYSEVSIATCIANPEPLTYNWKTNNAEMKFNFQNITSADYQIDYSKYSNQMTTYEINVKMGNQSVMSTASLTQYPISSEDIIDLSNHITVLSIGQNSGKFKISATLLDTTKSNSIGYLWSCHYADSQQPCALYSNPRQLLISRNIQNRKELVLNSESLKLSEHKFGLQAIDTNGNTSQILNSYTIVRVFEGNAPQVFIDSIYVRVDNNNIGLTFNRNQSNVISVPSMTRLVIRGFVRKLNQLDLIEWHLSQSLFQLSWNNIITKNGIISELHLYPDQISPFASYNISLKACNGKDVCSQVDRQLSAEPVVSQCVLTIQTNEKTDQIAFTTDRCNVPMTRLPLTYQLFATTDNNQMTPLTGPQFSSIIVLNSVQLIANGTSYYSVQVCDRYAFCQTINTTFDFEIKSTQYENESQIIDNLIKRSQKYSSFDPISALILLKGLMIDQKLSNELKAQYLRQISPEMIKHKGQLTYIYHTFGDIFQKTKDFNIKNDLIESIKQISGNTRICADIHTLDNLYTNVLNFYSFENKLYYQFNDSFGYFKKVNETQKYSYLSNIRHIFGNIMNCCAKQIPIGKYVKLGTKVELPNAVTLITHQRKFFEMHLTTKLNEWRNVTAFVKFNDKKIYKYMNKVSQNPQNIVHNSFVYAITLFPDQNPFRFDDKIYKLSPIVDISVHSPNSGQRLDTEFKVQNIKKEDKFDYIALMKVSLTGNETYGGTSYTTKCHYFNQKSEKWEMDGITELGISGSNGGCFMTHLTTLSLFRVVQHISSDYIFGVLVAVLMGVLIFGIMVVFFVQKKEQTIHLKPIKRQSYSNSYLNSYKNSFDDNYTKTYVY